MTRIGPQKKKWRACIFCPSTDTSREHLWSSWMHPLIVGSTHHTEVRASFIGKLGTPTGSPYKRERQGSTFNKRIRAVCKKCNNGWMNQIESAVRPWLTPLIEGRAVSLNAEAVRAVADWIVLKSIVSEYNHRDDEVTPRADRNAFKAGRTIPAWFHIAVAHHNVWEWGAQFWRHSTTIVPASAATDPLVTSKNIQTVTFGLGRLFVSVVASHGVPPDELFAHDDTLFPSVFPFTGQWLSWPPKRPLTAREMHAIADSLDTVIKEHPRLRWVEQPKPARGGGDG